LFAGTLKSISLTQFSIVDLRIDKFSVDDVSKDKYNCVPSNICGWVIDKSVFIHVLYQNVSADLGVPNYIKDPQSINEATSV